MVLYFGKHCCKMIIRGKPTIFGYKIWSLYSTDGYPYHLNIYTDKDGNNSVPLGSRVVNKMVDHSKSILILSIMKFILTIFLQVMTY